VFECTFRTAIDRLWIEMSPVRIGDAGFGAPSVYVTVERDGVPVARLDVYEREPAHYAFQEAIVWSDFVVIGFGGRAHLVSRTTRDVVTIALSGYFGHLYPLPEHLLIADREYLRCFDRTGAALWHSAELGIDGVIVDRVADGVIEGEGEWDPPGGWRSFRLRLSSGEVV
jgi:hypothetical protein